jgi:TP901-1 family phage major tail protein
MAAQAGKSILIKHDSNGSGTFVTLGGMRTKGLTINGETIDTTDSDSTGLQRELLDGGGVKSMSINGGGVFKDDAGTTACIARTLSGAIVEHQFIFPGLGTYEGLFQTTNAQLNGEYNGEAQFSLTFESAGEITFTAAA